MNTPADVVAAAVALLNEQPVAQQAAQASRKG
jgi:hypothetical protein